MCITLNGQTAHVKPSFCLSDINILIIDATALHLYLQAEAGLRSFECKFRSITCGRSTQTH